MSPNKDALYLFFDRIVDHSRPLSKPELLQLIDDREVHKLLGATKQNIHQISPPIVDSYIKEGGLNRSFVQPGHFPAPQHPSLPPTIPGPGGIPTPPVQTNPILIATDEPDETEDLLYILRRAREVAAQIRNPTNIRELKALYANECAFCKVQTIGGLNPTTFYSEAAHIKPVGEPHNGPDTKENMILLCSDHHLQFDRGLHSIRIHDKKLYVQSKIPSSPIDGNEVTILAPHALRADCIEYHRKTWHYK